MSQAEAVVDMTEEGDVLVILLNRPQMANALNGEMLDALRRAFDRACDVCYRAVVIGGRGRNFCAGSDLGAAIVDPGAMDLRTRFHPVMLALADLDKPVVAAVNGAAAGGGFSLALAADMRVMGAKARLIPSWLALGLVPDLGASWHLSRHMGPTRAFSWLVKGTPMDSEAARAEGLADRVVADGMEVAEAVALARDLAAIPGPAVALTRRLLAQASTSNLPAQLDAEAIAQADAMRDPDQIAALAMRVAQLTDRPK